MAFFPDIYHVSADIEKNLLLLSLRLSEDVAELYELQPIQCKPFIEAQSFESWQGTSAIRAKIKNNEATLNLDTAEGSKFYRLQVPQLLILQAQMRAESKPLSFNETLSLDLETKLQAASTSTDLDYDKIRQIIKQEFLLMKRELLADLKLVRVQTDYVEPTPEESFKPQKDKMFIPSDLIHNDISSTIKTSTQASTESFEEQLTKLKNMRQKK